MSHNTEETFMNALGLFAIRLLDDARTKGLVFVVMLLFLGASGWLSHHLYQKVEGLTKDLTACATSSAAQDVTIQFLVKEVEGLKAQIYGPPTLTRARRGK